MKIYMLTGLLGQYSDLEYWNCCAFTSKEQAITLKEELNNFEAWRWIENPDWNRRNRTEDTPYFINDKEEDVPENKKHLIKYYRNREFPTYDQSYFDVEEIELIKEN